MDGVFQANKRKVRQTMQRVMGQYPQPSGQERQLVRRGTRGDFPSAGGVQDELVFDGQDSQRKNRELHQELLLLLHKENQVKSAFLADEGDLFVENQTASQLGVLPRGVQPGVSEVQLAVLQDPQVYLQPRGVSQFSGIYARTDLRQELELL